VAKWGRRRNFSSYLKIVCFFPFFGVPDVVVIDNPNDEGRIILGKKPDSFDSAKKTVPKVMRM